MTHALCFLSLLLQRLAETADQPFPPVTIAIVGKYCKLQDAYLSVIKVRGVGSISGVRHNLCLLLCMADCMT